MIRRARRGMSYRNWRSGRGTIHCYCRRRLLDKPNSSRARRALWKAKAARDEVHDGFGAAATNQSLRLAVEAVGSALGETEAGGAGQVSDVDRRRATAAGRLSRLASG